MMAVRIEGTNIDALPPNSSSLTRVKRLSGYIFIENQNDLLHMPADTCSPLSFLQKDGPYQCRSQILLRTR